MDLLNEYIAALQTVGGRMFIFETSRGIHVGYTKNDQRHIVTKRQHFTPDEALREAIDTIKKPLKGKLP